MKQDADTVQLAEHALAPSHESPGPARPSSLSGIGRSTLGSSLGTLDWRQALGGALIGIGMVAIVIAWWQISGTPHPGEQMPSFASGGLGGVALIAVGVLLVNAFEHAKDRAALFEVLERIDDLEREAQAGDARILEELARLSRLVGGMRSANGTAGRTRRSSAGTGAP